MLSDRVDHLMRLKGMVEDLCPGFMGWTAEIDGKSGKAYREQQLFLMRSGDNTVLFATYALAKEGLDIPCLDRLYMATPVKDYAVVTQAIGRIARTCEGKSDPICYDFVDNIGYLQKAYKTRCSTYKKNHCYFVKEGE
jgi:superfamily II DNA or RNA helicase